MSPEADCLYFILVNELNKVPGLETNGTSCCIKVRKSEKSVERPFRLSMPESKYLERNKHNMCKHPLESKAEKEESIIFVLLATPSSSSPFSAEVCMLLPGVACRWQPRKAKIK